MIKVDISGIAPFFTEEQLHIIDQEGDLAFQTLTHKTGKGKDFTGWVDYPANVTNRELEHIAETADRIRSLSQVLVILGIGGSYLGAKAAIDQLCSPEYNLLPNTSLEIFFLGNGASGAQIKRIIRIIGDRDLSVCVISKSGSTAETASAFRIFRELLVQRYGPVGANQRIHAVTDAEHGYLRASVRENGWDSFDLERDIGGRYSVLTPVGMLPMAAAGIDIKKVLGGAVAERDDLLSSSGGDALTYAKTRQTLYRSGKVIEILSSFEPSFRYMGEWWKQLFAESEGKEDRGIFTASASMTADLHSLGQMIQDGQRNIFETIVTFPEVNDLNIPTGDFDDGLQWLGGKSYSEFNSSVEQAAKEAHISGGVPVISIDAGPVSEENFGRLIYFFEFACGLSGYISGVNPFDQPGVEEYKKNMRTIMAQKK